MKNKPSNRRGGRTMNAMCRSRMLALAVFGVATILTSLHNLSSIQRSMSVNKELYLAGKSSNSPYVSSSKLHYQLDEALATKYSTTHQNIKGTFSQILNDRDETHSHSNDFQHKGILRTSTEKHGKWMKIRWMHPNTELIIAGETVHKAGTNYSKFVEDTRLVIDVNHTVLFPTEEQDPMANNDSHLCHILRLVTGRMNLGVSQEQGTPPAVLNISADCDMFNQQANGQGAALMALYRARMITALAKVDFTFQCIDNEDTNFPNEYMKEKSRKLKWVFPWFASHQSSSDDTDPWPYRGEAPSEEQLCLTANVTSKNAVPIESMADQIREDVRKMALQLMGSHPKRIHPLIPLDVKPWVPGISMDDVVIHVPCYSDMGDSATMQRTRVEMMQFHEYTKHISKSVTTIGILLDDTNDGVCHRASSLLKEYLRSHYPKASVSVYENDTLPLQYARIAMAKQSFSSFSDFGMIPIIGTFGEGYFQPLPQNRIFQNILNYKGFENLHMMNGNVLSPEGMDAMSFSELSKWLVASEESE